MKNELDRRRKYYLILDCETATLPFASSINNPTAKQRVAIAKPLIYDLGWTVIDKRGNIYKKKSFLISEIFSVPSVFNTAYYAEKRPQYIEQLNGGAIDLVTWKTATAELEHDLALVEGVGAYNAMFDFKKAIPFTELYINQLYGNDFYKWEKYQNAICADIASGNRRESNQEFDPETFRFRGKEYKLFDVWGLTCKHLVNNDDYKRMCMENGWQTASGKYFKTSAETTFRFCAEELEFEEAHTALADAIIESFLFAKVATATKGKFEMGIEHFPFRILGTVERFETEEAIRKGLIF